jgi:hypothetical protein
MQDDQRGDWTSAATSWRHISAVVEAVDTTKTPARLPCITANAKSRHVGAAMLERTVLPPWRARPRPYRSAFARLGAGTTSPFQRWTNTEEPLDIGPLQRYLASRPRKRCGPTILAPLREAYVAEEHDHG